MSCFFIAVHSDDIATLGVSIKDGVLSFNSFNWSLASTDKITIGVSVVFDVFDSIKEELVLREWS